MPDEKFVKGKARNELVVVLHGLSGSPRTMSGVIESAAAARPDADILAIKLAFGGPLGVLAVRPSEQIAAKVVKRIDAAIDARGESGEPPGAYEHFFLVGHSFGGVIARKVAVLANGEFPDAAFEPRLRGEFGSGRKWGTKIERIVLLAGMSRGWSPASVRDWATAAKWTVGSWAGELLAAASLGWLRPTVTGIRQGAPFIVQTRLQWMALARDNARAGRPSILGVQLLGAADDLVAPDDSVDFACDLGSGDETSFVLIELPFATHDNAHLMAKPTAGQLKLIEDGIARGNLSVVCKKYQLVRQAKWMLFGRALSRSRNNFNDIKIDPNDMSDTPALQPDNTATHVVFVIHGIRDHGFWTQKIARVIKKEAEKDNKSRTENERHSFRSFTGSYGYFAMVPFVLPWIRRWKSEWLMDHYVEVCARYPKADISFVGHSNGTYLLARALADYPAAYFKRVVLAGSVIRRDFDWAKWLKRECNRRPRVTEVLNYVATRDWVVAIFSKAFQPFRFFDLGSAGHDGFDQFGGRGCHKRLSESHYIEGSHSAALTETQWDDIARFIVKGGAAPGFPDADFRSQRRWWMVVSGWISTLILVGLLWLVIGFGIALIYSVHGEGVFRLGSPAANLHGYECQADLCGFFALFGRYLVSPLNWLWAALQGQITAPVVGPPGGVWPVVRGVICGVYWWCVYIIATRF
jgi:alpha-beta hydrolase superfamily lysophospholipase